MNSYKIYESKGENPQFIFLEKVKAMFITIIEKERKTNDLKIYLSNSPTPSLMNLFLAIDTKDKGYIDVNDLEKFLQHYSISFNHQILRRFIYLYDKHQKFHLLYDDFCRIFKPYDNYSKKPIMNNKLTGEDLFLDVLIAYFELIEQINEMTNDIRKTNNFTSYEAFMGITKGNKYLDEEFLNHFLDHNYNKNEIKNLLYILDSNNDSLVSYEEFQDFFIPLIKYEEELDKSNNYEYDNNNFNDKENEKWMNKYDLYESDNNFDSTNYKDKFDNDIVNYEKSGKYRGNSPNMGREEKEKEKERKNKNYEQKYYNNSISQKQINVSKNYTNNIKSYNGYKECSVNKNDNNYNSTNELKYTKINLNNYSKENKLKLSEDEHNINDSNNFYEYENKNENENENDNYFDNINCFSNDTDRDVYCKFYKKTKKVLSPKKNDKSSVSQETNINSLQKTPDFNVKKDKNYKMNINGRNITNKKIIEKEYCNKRNGSNDRNYTYNNIKKDNDYILNIVDDNNNKNNYKEIKKNNKLNVNHTEIQYLPNNKLVKGLLSKDKDKENDTDNDTSNFNYNTIKKEEKGINLINFTCGARTESEKGNSSAKKNNISDNDNDLYNLSNDNNKISKHINISESHKSQNSYNFKNNVNEDSNNNIFESFSDKINRETLNKKIKEYNNTSLKNFIKYVQFLVKSEKKTISSKDQLCLREDITLKQLFCIFDYNKKNNISKNEFKVVCKKIFGLYPTSDQIVLVFKRYDKNKDDNLNLREFLGMIKPLKEEYGSFLFNKKKNGNKSEGYQQLSSKSKKLLVEMIRGIIEDEGNYYKFKDDMISQNLFELNSLWENISKYSNNSKGLDKLEMNKLLTDNGCSLSQYDLDVLFNKMDYDDDQIISYEDLTQEFVNYY